MWDKTIEDFEMILAARDAQIYDDIMAKTDGFDHMLTEGGKDLSGGQRQRLEIARVLAQDPSIIILDEATSAMDNITEKNVMSNILNKLKNKTIIIIAHRLETIKDVDNIFVLSNGKIVEEGKYLDLLEKNGCFKDLYKSIK